MENKPELHSRKTRGIKIVNPPVTYTGGGYTTPAKARALVRRSRAEWIEQGASIKLLNTSGRANALKAARKQAFEHERAIERFLAKKEAERGYDGVDRVMTATELRNLPMTGDVSRLLMRR